MSIRSISLNFTDYHLVEGHPNIIRIDLFHDR